MHLLLPAHQIMLHCLSTQEMEASELPISAVSLHSAFPTDLGLNEIAGSGYVRATGAAWGHPLQNTMSLEDQPEFLVPAGDIEWLGLWDVDGLLMGYVPNGGGTLSPFAVTDSPADTMHAPAHPFVDDDSVVVWKAAAEEGVTHYVRDAATHTLKLALTPGGAAVDLTPGAGFLQRIQIVTYDAPGVFRLNSLVLVAGT